MIQLVKVRNILCYHRHWSFFCKLLLHTDDFDPDVAACDENPKECPARNANGGVDFSDSEHLYPVDGCQKNIVKIEYTGSRRQDYAAANKAACISSTQRPPDNYTWHHLDDYDPITNTGTMQLIERSAHEAAYPHNGGVRQYEQATGVKYK